MLDLEMPNYLIGNRFSVIDIIASFTVQWGRSQGLIDDFCGLHAYLERLSGRPNNTLKSIGQLRLAICHKSRRKFAHQGLRSSSYLLPGFIKRRIIAIIRIRNILTCLALDMIQKQR